jgi:hypothetical protein
MPFMTHLGKQQEESKAKSVVERWLSDTDRDENRKGDYQGDQQPKWDDWKNGSRL